MEHTCAENQHCICSVQALEPNEDCPVHGPGPWPPGCEKCGKFMTRKHTFACDIEE